MPPRPLEYKPVERTILVLRKTDMKVHNNTQPEHYWKLTGDTQWRTLQEWINIFFEVKAGKEYIWRIMHTTSTYIIVERSKWEKIK